MCLYCFHLPLHSCLNCFHLPLHMCLDCFHLHLHICLYCKYKSRSKQIKAKKFKTIAPFRLIYTLSATIARPLNDCRAKIVRFSLSIVFRLFFFSQVWQNYLFVRKFKSEIFKKKMFCINTDLVNSKNELKTAK
jgi:hypothetical protein